MEDAIPLKAMMTDVVTQMVNEETGVRGYIISGDPDALAPYNEGREKVEENLSNARPLLAKHPIMADLVAQAEPETSASTQEISASAQELARTAERLQQLVGRSQLAN